MPAEFHVPLKPALSPVKFLRERLPHRLFPTADINWTKELFFHPCPVVKNIRWSRITIISLNNVLFFFFLCPIELERINNLWIRQGGGRFDKLLKLKNREAWLWIFLLSLFLYTHIYMFETIVLDLVIDFFCYKYFNWKKYEINYRCVCACVDILFLIFVKRRFSIDFKHIERFQLIKLDLKTITITNV